MPLRASYSSSSDSDDSGPRLRKTTVAASDRLRKIFGGGKFADVVLWKEKKISAGVLAGVTAVWSFFELMEYNFLTLLCHLTMLALTVLFFQSVLAALFDREPMKLPEELISEAKVREIALASHKKLTSFISVLYDIGSGKNLKLFFMTIFSLWILSILGTCCDSISILYVCFLCLHILPVLYEHFEEEMDELAYKGNRKMKRFYRRINLKVLNKIPRGPVKEKKKKHKM